MLIDVRIKSMLIDRLNLFTNKWFSGNFFSPHYFLKKEKKLLLVHS